MNDKNVFFLEITAKLNKRIRTTKQYWQIVLKKHPPVANLIREVKETLESPDEIRLSRKDESVFLYYRHYTTFILCVVVRHTNGTGYIITLYPTSNIKIGRCVWKK